MLNCINQYCEYYMYIRSLILVLQAYAHAYIRNKVVWFIDRNIIHENKTTNKHTYTQNHWNLNFIWTFFDVYTWLFDRTKLFHRKFMRLQYFSAIVLYQKYTHTYNWMRLQLDRLYTWQMNVWYCRLWLVAKWYHLRLKHFSTACVWIKGRRLFMYTLYIYETSDKWEDRIYKINMSLSLPHWYSPLRQTCFQRIQKSIYLWERCPGMRLHVGILNKYFALVICSHHSAFTNSFSHRSHIIRYTCILYVYVYIL